MFMFYYNSAFVRERVGHLCGRGGELRPDPISIRLLLLLLTTKTEIEIRLLLLLYYYYYYTILASCDYRNTIDRIEVNGG